MSFNIRTNVTCLKIEMHDLDLHNPKPSRLLPAFKCRPILVNTASPDEESCLVLADGRLVSVLVRVAGAGVKQGGKELSGWHMEAGFGRCAVFVPLL